MLNSLQRETRSQAFYGVLRGIAYAVVGWVRTGWFALTHPDYEGRSHDLYILRCEVGDFLRWLAPFERYRCDECPRRYAKVFWRWRRLECPHDDLPF